MESPDKFYNQLVKLRRAIDKLTVTNNFIARSLQKEVDKNGTLLLQLNSAKKDVNYYQNKYYECSGTESRLRDQIKSIQEQLETAVSDKNVLLRKLVDPKLKKDNNDIPKK